MRDDLPEQFDYSQKFPTHVFFYESAALRFLLAHIFSG